MFAQRAFSSHETDPCVLPRGVLLFPTKNHVFFLNALLPSPHRVTVFSQGACSSHHTESWRFPEKKGSGSHHTKSLRFPNSFVALTTQSQFVFPTGVLLPPHRIVVFSEGVLGFPHTELLCFPTGCSDLAIESPRIFQRVAWPSPQRIRVPLPRSNTL